MTTLYRWDPTLGDNYASRLPASVGRLPVDPVFFEEYLPTYGLPPSTGGLIIRGSVAAIALPASWSLACWVAWHSVTATRTILRVRAGETVLGTITNKRVSTTNCIEAVCGGTFVTDAHADYQSTGWHSLIVTCTDSGGTTSIEVYLDDPTTARSGTSTPGATLTGIDALDISLATGGLRFGSVQLSTPMTLADRLAWYNAGHGQRLPPTRRRQLTP